MGLVLVVLQLAEEGIGIVELGFQLCDVALLSLQKWVQGLDQHVVGVICWL